jgi:Cytidylate kinase
MEVNMRVLLEELKDRDRKDREREHSPLVAAEDSVELDTTKIEPEGVIRKIKALPFFK